MDSTRQLPMGAGHCQWGGLTDQNICNIYRGAHLASRYRAMLRPRSFYLSAKNGGSRSNGLNATGVHGRTNRKLGNI